MNVAKLLMSQFVPYKTPVPPLVSMPIRRNPRVSLNIYSGASRNASFLCDLVFYAQCKSCRCYVIPALPVESSDLVTMMYSLSTYKLFLSHYLLLTFNKILKLIFHCRIRLSRFPVQHLVASWFSLMKNYFVSKF